MSPPLLSRLHEFLPDDEREAAEFGPRRMERLLLDEYRNTSLEEAAGCRPLQLDGDEVLHRSRELDTWLQTPRDGGETILTDLKLVHGIGPTREERLKEEGYRDLHDLSGHPDWGGAARETLKTLDGQGPAGRFRELTRTRPASHPDVLRLAGDHSPEDFAVLDIETLGLSGEPIVLVGLALPGEGGGELHQYLVRHPDEEAAALRALTDDLETGEALISFNGRSFDLPYITDRMTHHGIEPPEERPHFDLYQFSRRAWRELPDNRLDTIERHVLDLHRPVDLPSSAVPRFYRTYLREKNPGPLLPILEHNAQDIASLIHLFEELNRELVVGEGLEPE